PVALRPHRENWLFGCDLCQEVYPWNGAERDATGAEVLTPALLPLLALDAPGFHARFGRTAVRRAKRRGLLRNVAVALGNSGNPEAIPPLRAALGDSEPLIRGHAAWALGQFAEPEARLALRQHLASEEDAEVRAEVLSALGEEPTPLSPHTDDSRTYR